MQLLDANSNSFDLNTSTPNIEEEKDKMKCFIINVLLPNADLNWFNFNTSIKHQRRKKKER